MDNAQRGTPNQVEATWLRLQILFMVSGAGFYTVALITIFFNIEQIMASVIK